MLSVIYCLVTGLILTSAKKCKKACDMAVPYPTNFYEDMVPKFVNNRPMIGIAAMEIMGQKMLVEVPWSHDKDYFGGSFVKLVEAAGGRAVPVLEDISVTDLDRLLHKLNGFILPGGDADVSDSGYARVSKQVINFSKRMAKRGIKFPVLGICRGAQMMMLAEAKSDFLIETDSLNLSIPLDFANEYKESRLFGHAPKDLIKSLAKRSITMNAHALGIPTLSFYNNTDLMKKFRVISTNYDRNGTQFVSTFEGLHAPLYGLQWHPEKALFVFNPVLAVDHSIHSIIASQYVANFFMAEARMNPGTFRDRQEEEDHSLASRATPTFVGNITETPYDLIYMFDFEKPFTFEKPEAK